jgi:hypothetical protein
MSAHQLALLQVLCRLLLACVAVLGTASVVLGPFLWTQGLCAVLVLFSDLPVAYLVCGCPVTTT